MNDTYKAQNQEDDAAVLKLLTAQSHTFTHLLVALGWDTFGECRRLDKSLTRLKRAGKIKFHGPKAGWRATPTECVATHCYAVAEPAVPCPDTKDCGANGCRKYR